MTAGWWWTVVLVGVLGAWQLWTMLRLQATRKDVERVHGLYRALAKDVAELRSDVGDLIPLPPPSSPIPTTAPVRVRAGTNSEAQPPDSDYASLLSRSVESTRVES